VGHLACERSGNGSFGTLIFAYFTEATWRMIECAPRLIGEGLGGCQLNTENLNHGCTLLNDPHTERIDTSAL
jgi:hypothetical protein